LDARGRRPFRPPLYATGGAVLFAMEIHGDCQILMWYFLTKHSTKDHNYSKGAMDC